MASGSRSSSCKSKQTEKMAGEAETSKEELLERSIEDIRSKMKEKRRKKVQADRSLSKSRHKNATLVLKASLRQNNRSLAQSLEVARNESRQAQQGLIELQRERHLLQSVVNRYQEQHSKQRNQIMGVRELLNKVTTSLLDTVGILGQALDMCIMPRQTKDSSLGLVFRNSSVNSDDLSDLEKKETRRPATPKKSSVQEQASTKQRSRSPVQNTSPDPTEDQGSTSSPEIKDGTEALPSRLSDIDIPLMFVTDETNPHDKVRNRRETKKISAGNPSHHQLPRRTSSLLDPMAIAAAALEVGKSVDMIRTVVEETRVEDSSSDAGESPEGEETREGDDLNDEEEKEEESTETKVRERKSKRHSQRRGTFVKGQNQVEDLVGEEEMVDENVDSQDAEMDVDRGKGRRRGSRKERRGTFVKGQNQVEEMVDEEKMVVENNDSQDGEMDVDHHGKGRRRSSRKERRGTFVKGQNQVEKIVVENVDSQDGEMEVDHGKERGRGSRKRSTFTKEIKSLEDEVEVIVEDQDTVMSESITESGEDPKIEKEDRKVEKEDRLAEKSDYKFVDMEMTSTALGHISLSEVSKTKAVSGLDVSEGCKMGSLPSSSSLLTGRGDASHKTGCGAGKGGEKAKKSKLPLMRKDKAVSSKLQKVSSKGQSRPGHKMKKKKDKIVDNMEEKDVTQMTIFDLSMGDSFSHPTPSRLGQTHSKAQPLSSELSSRGGAGDRDVEVSHGVDVPDPVVAKSRAAEKAMTVVSSDDDRNGVPGDKQCKIKRKSRKSKSVVTPGAASSKLQMAKKALLEELSNLDSSYVADVTNQERRSMIESALPSRKSHSKEERESLSDLIAKPLTHKSSKRKLSKQQFYLGKEDLGDQEKGSKSEQNRDRHSKTGMSRDTENPEKSILDDGKCDRQSTFGVLNTTPDILEDLDTTLLELDKHVKAKGIKRRTAILKSKKPAAHLNLNVTFDLDQQCDKDVRAADPKVNRVLEKGSKQKKLIRMTYSLEKPNESPGKTFDSEDVRVREDDDYDDVFEKIPTARRLEENAECRSHDIDEEPSRKASIDPHERKEGMKRCQISDHSMAMAAVSQTQRGNDAECLQRENVKKYKIRKEKKARSSKKRLAEEESSTGEGRQPTKVAKIEEPARVSRSDEAADAPGIQRVMVDLTNTSPCPGKGGSGPKAPLAHSSKWRKSAEGESRRSAAEVGQAITVNDDQQEPDDASEQRAQKDEEENAQRRPRRSKMVSYKEPSLNSKLRQGDPNTDTIYKGLPGTKSRKSDQKRAALSNITNQSGSDRQSLASDDVPASKTGFVPSQEPEPAAALDQAV